MTALAAAKPVEKPGAVRAYVRIILAIASLLVFAAAALLLRQGDHDSDKWEFDVDRLPIAAAVSTIVYGAPIGSYYHGVEQALLDFDTPIKVSFGRVTSGIPLGDLVPAHFGGIGTGFPMVTLAAMYVFGVHLSSIVIMFSCLMGVTTFLFLLRFNDDRALFVPITFGVLTVMMVTPLATNAFNAGQVPVGGYRYFSMLGVIPGMHLFLELVSNNAHRPPWNKKGASLAVLQSIMLSVSLFINVATIYLAGTIIFGCMIALVRRRGDSRQPRAVVSETLLIAVIFVSVFILLKVIAGQFYATGTSDMVWHRVFISLGANPAWPFGDLHQVYSTCQQHIPKGLVPSIVDRNAGCVWDSYAQAHDISGAQKTAQRYGPLYEAALRAAFFNVVLQYPKQVFVTFFYYKPLLLASTLRSIFSFDFLFSWPISVMVVLQFLITTVYSYSISADPRSNHITTLAAGLVISAVCCCVIYLAAWSLPWTSSELLFYVIAIVAIALTAGLKYAYQGLPALIRHVPH